MSGLLQWRWSAVENTNALVAASPRHEVGYIIGQVDGSNWWELIHPWSVTSRIKTAQSEFFQSIWEAMAEAERMEREGTRFAQEASE